MLNRQVRRLQGKPKSQEERKKAVERSKKATAKKKAEKKLPGRILQFLREVRAEMKKVIWPSKEEVVNYTLVVLITVCLAAGFVYLLDLLFSKLLTLIIA
ncbi:MAG: preprotein translocase subunit SecE [Actinomycetota bacterium]|nr:preprotein translocase subunit SecE [Actinomycetota bacterium]